MCVCIYKNMRNLTLSTYIMYITHNVHYTTVDDKLIITAAVAVVLELYGTTAELQWQICSIL